MSEVAIREAYRLHHLGRAMEALAVLDQAVSLAPREASLLNVRAMILDAQGRHEEALGNLQAALRIQPDFPDALNNRGIHHARERHFEQALVCYDRSLALEPAQPHARYNRATARLTVGDWLRGFRDFESRWALFPHEATRIARLKPVWLGERDVAGSTLLLHHEQGYGDTLQFCRYVLLVMRLGARVILAVPAALRNLMESLPGRPQVVAEGEPIPAHDYCCSLMSLPHVFCTTPETVPAEIPYLAADAAAARLWRDRLGEGTRLRVGLVWSGRRYPPINHSRDMPLDLLRPLLALNADFVCLQTELSVPERALLAATPNVIRYADVFEDFADTAALIENLDLILTVDTAVAHLAGALGKPVWLMNRYTSCWRWLQQRPDSPWYPTMRIFWQPSPGDWSSVVQDVLAALTGRIAQQEMTQATSVRSPESVLTLLEKSLAQHHQGRVEQAIEGYRGVLTLDPLHPDALHFLGIALAQSGRHEQALAPLALVLRLQPENATAHIHYGNALAGLLRHQEALESYEHAIQLTPSLTDAHYNRGTMLMALGVTKLPCTAIRKLSSSTRATCARITISATRSTSRVAIWKRFTITNRRRRETLNSPMPGRTPPTRCDVSPATRRRSLIAARHSSTRRITLKRIALTGQRSRPWVVTMKRCKATSRRSGLNPTWPKQLGTKLSRCSQRAPSAKVGLAMRRAGESKASI